MIQKPNPRFKNYKHIFNNLVKHSNVKTLYPLVTMCISNDSKVAITITKRNDQEYWVKQYSLETYELVFEEMIGGGDDQYIKCKEVEQSNDSSKCAICYNDDGKFCVRVFGREVRSEQEIKDSEIDCNKLLNLTDYTMCNASFPDPFINMCFISNHMIFIALFHNYDKLHYHFIYDLETKSIVGDVQKIDLKCPKTNFTYRAFYNDD